jgi:hypothetical protein
MASHNALAQWQKVFASNSFEPVSYPKVIVRSKVDPLLLLKVIALRTDLRDNIVMQLPFEVTFPTSAEVAGGPPSSSARGAGQRC